MKNSFLIVLAIFIVLISSCLIANAAEELSIATDVYGGSLDYSVSALSAQGANLTGFDGTEVIFNSNELWNVIDARGTGQGWQVIVSATEPTSDAHHISLSNLTVDVVSLAKIANAQSSTDPTKLTKASGQELTSGVTLLAAPINEGMGSFEYSPVFKLKIPANAYTGNYTSVITTTIYESAPIIN